jgi:transposase
MPSSAKTAPAAPTAHTTPAAPSTIYVGLDVHKDSLTLAVLPADAPAPTRVDKPPNDLAKLRRYLDRLATQGTLRLCYEASGAGYVLHRAITSWGYACDVIAPSLIPQKPGHRRKHDRHDATQLAHYYRSGDLTPIRIPTEAEERVRDVVRCRETLQRELIKSRHYILKFLARRGFVYREGTNWSRPHLRWLTALARDDSPLTAEDRFVFREYLALFEYKLQRRDALDVEIEQLALRPALRDAVGRLQCFRGISVHAAMVLATELVDWRRFGSPRELAAYLGLVPREDSSGDRERKGSITKAGNTHCRHALIQAAWSYRHVPKVAAHLQARQAGQPPGVIAHAWKAQQRLHKRYAHLSYRKQPQVAVVAVARELVGFLWAVMQDLAPAAPAPQSA